jgi:hypothetical protein
VEGDQDEAGGEERGCGHAGEVLGQGVVREE